MGAGRSKLGNKILLFLLGVACAASVVHATGSFGLAVASGDDGAYSLTLTEAIQRALDDAPTLQLARFDVEEAMIGLREAELGQLAGQPRNEYEQVLRRLHDAQEAYIDQLAHIALQVEEAYYKVLGSGEALTIQKSNVEQADRQFALTKARYEAGLIARQDFLEAELSYEQTIYTLETVEREHDDAWRHLRRLVGLDDETALRLHDDVSFEPLHIELHVAVSEALTNRSEIRRAERAVGQADTAVRQAAAPYAAPVELDRAEMNLARAKIQLEETIRQIEDEVRNEWFALVDLSRNVEVTARKERLAHNKVEISRTRYEGGAIALLQLLQDEETYARARQDAVGAMWDYNLARARFWRTLGRSQLPPLPPAVADYIESWLDE